MKRMLGRMLFFGAILVSCLLQEVRGGDIGSSFQEGCTAKVAVNATVLEPPRVYLRANNVYTESDTEGISVTVQLSVTYSDTLYAYILPVNGDAITNCTSKLFATDANGVPAAKCYIKLVDDKPVTPAEKIFLNDGQPSYPEFQVVLCTTQTYDTNSIVSVFQSDTLAITVNNRAPVVNAINVGGMFVQAGGTTPKTPVGIPKKFEAKIDDVQADLSITNDTAHCHVVKWSITDGRDVYPQTYYTMGSNTLWYAFENEGKNVVEVQVLDKDMRSPGDFTWVTDPDEEGGGRWYEKDGLVWGKSSTIYVNVVEKPYVIVEPAWGSDMIQETDSCTFNISLSAAPLKRVNIVVDILKNGLPVDGLTLSTNNFSVLANKNPVNVLTLSNLDGTDWSKGLTVTATVTNETIDTATGAKMNDLYGQGVCSFGIDNVAPIIALPLESANMIIKAINQDFDICWQVQDVRADLDDGMTVEFLSDDAASEPFVRTSQKGLASVQSGIYTTRFTSYGDHTITMNVTDKDGGFATRTWSYQVPPSVDPFEIGFSYEVRNGIPLVKAPDLQYLQQNGGCLELPSMKQGIPIGGVAAQAFQGLGELVSIVIPEGYTEIEDSAFERCYNLATVSLPSTLRRIGKSAFRECVSLTNVVVPASVATVDCFAFRDCRNLAGVDLRCAAGGLRAGVFDGTPRYGLKAPGEAPTSPGATVSTNFVFETVTNVVHTSSEITNVVHTSSTVSHYTEVTNFVFETVTNVVRTFETVTSVVHTCSTVTNVVEYVPEAGTSPSEVYSAKAGRDAPQVVAGAAGWDVMELPKGMAWDRETGTLSGTPVQSGVYDVILVSGSGANTRMMRTTVEVANFDPVVGYVGTAFAWKGVPVSLFSGYKSLPAGLKWNASAKALAGVPTKAGDFSRKTTYGDLVDFRVLALPAGATGTFNGIATNAVGTSCPVVVSAASTGKVAVKVTKGSTTYTLAAKNWSGVAVGADGRRVFTAKATAKGGLSAVVTVDADADWKEDSLSVVFSGGAVAGLSGTAQRNAFAKVDEAKILGTSLAGSYMFNLETAPGGYNLVLPDFGKVGKMTVVVKTTGVSTLKGKLDSKTTVSATATVHVDADGNASLVFFYKGKRFVWGW